MATSLPFTNSWNTGKSAARVIVYGVKRYNYFPMFLSRAVIASVLFGEGSIPSSFLLESFLLYVSQEERETILIALGDKFDPNDGDLLDFLSNFKCFTKVTAGNISRVIHELAHRASAHQELLDCFVPILSVLRAFPAFQNLQGLQEMYLEKKPTTHMDDEGSGTGILGPGSHSGSQSSPECDPGPRIPVPEPLIIHVCV